MLETYFVCLLDKNFWLGNYNKSKKSIFTLCNFNISELKIYAIAICAVTGGKSCENVTSSIPEETKIIAPVDHCYSAL